MENVKLDAVEMLDAIEAASQKAAELGFDGIFERLDDLAEGLANYYNIER